MEGVRFIGVGLSEGFKGHETSGLVLAWTAGEFYKL